jgi:alpha-L-rhamnosidase
MERYARLLGKDSDAVACREQADRVRAAFNRSFYKPEAGCYDNGSQTSSVLPLALGLATGDQRPKVFAHLVNKISRETPNHIGTGLVGGQWLMRTLSDLGRADLAYTLATQESYPSWGYMLRRGATTVWELWNGDTADPAMNSGNHVMLVGDLAIWLHEYLAGIRPDPARPGFKHIVMRPQPVGDLRWVRALYRSLHGPIRSAWKRDGAWFEWQINVPPNTTATVHVPTSDPAAVCEGGRNLAAAERSGDRAVSGIRRLESEGARAVFTVGSGHYRFTSPLAPASPAGEPKP